MSTPRSVGKVRAPAVREGLAAIARGRAALVRSLALRVGSRADAEDLVQSALLEAVERAVDLRDQDKLVAWFGRILATSRGAACRPHMWRIGPHEGVEGNFP